MKEKSTYSLLIDFINSQEINESNYFDINSIANNSTLFFKLKTLNSLIYTLKNIPGTNDIELYKQVFNTTNSLYKSIGGQDFELTTILLSLLYSKSKKEIHNEILSFLINSIQPEDFFKLNDSMYCVFSILLKFEEVEILKSIIQQYDINKTDSKDHALNFNNNPQTLLYNNSKPNFISQKNSNYLSKQNVLLLSIFYSYINNKYNSQDFFDYFKLQTQFIGKSTEEEKEFILSWLIHSQQNMHILKIFMDETGYLLSSNNGKALELFIKNYDIEEVYFDFLKPYKHIIQDKFDINELIFSWIKNHTDTNINVEKIIKIKEKAEKIYSFLSDNKKSLNFQEEYYQNYFIKHYKESIGTKIKNKEIEKDFLTTTILINNYFQELKDEVKILENNKKKRL